MEEHDSPRAIALKKSITIMYCTVLFDDDVKRHGLWSLMMSGSSNLTMTTDWHAGILLDDSSLGAIFGGCSVH